MNPNLEIVTVAILIEYLKSCRQDRIVTILNPVWRGSPIHKFDLANSFSEEQMYQNEVGQINDDETGKPIDVLAIYNY
jgi:hypothetical protein